MPKAAVIHDMPGRTRLRIVDRRRDVAYFSETARAFGTLDGVLSVNARPETASVLIHHRLSLGALANFADQEGLFTLDASRDADAAAMEVWQTAVQSFTRMNLKDLETPTAIVLAVVAAYQVTRGQLFSPAATHLMHVFELMRRRT